MSDDEKWVRGRVRLAYWSGERFVAEGIGEAFSWSELRELIEQRLEEIRCLKEEIEYQEQYRDGEYTDRVPVIDRTIIRLRTLLAEKQAGMKTDDSSQKG